MLYKRNCCRLRRSLLKVVLIILFICISFFVLFEYKARDLVHNSVDNELEIHAVNSIDAAVMKILSEESVKYDDLIYKNITEEGSVTSLQTNTMAINMLKSRLSLKITEYIKEEYVAKVGVPAGAFTGLVLLSSTGPDITITLNLNGSVVTNIRSEFISAGINQTLHRIYLVVDADISLTCPILSYETNIITEYELCQTVIVGNTPDMFADIT